MANSVDPDRTAPIGAVCSGHTLFASILNSSVMLGNYLQQTTFSDAFFSWRFKCEKKLKKIYIYFLNWEKQTWYWEKRWLFSIENGAKIRAENALSPYCQGPP